MSCPEAGVFSSFASGDLDAEARSKLELHVDTCERCRVLLSETFRGRTAAVPAPRGLPAPGDSVDRYLIVGELGAGAMGVVYLARDPELDRELAIKLVHPQLGGAEDELVQQRMLREGRALARIDHPNVVRVLDVGRWNGAWFVAMERAQGQSLRAWLAAAPRSVAAIVDVFSQCAAGLAAAHDAGIVHRDVKPDNVVVDTAGRARVTDFGLAISEAVPTDEMRTAPTAPMAAVTALASRDVRLTRTHGVVGTPAYMAPEQHRAGAVDGRSNQFALCIALAEALTGVRPFSGDTLDERLADIESGRLRFEAAVPRRLRRILERGLAFRPEQRFPSMHALGRALVLRPRWPWLAAVTLVAGAGVAGLAVHTIDEDPCADAAASLDRAWNPARAQQIAAAFGASGKPFAEPAWTYTRGAVERYAARWRSERVASCRASPSRPTTIRCLERRASELDALLARWQEGTVETLAAAPFAVDALSPAARCAGAELDPLPESVTDRARVGALEARFYAARADDLAGRAPAAAAAMTTLLPDLAPLPVLRAEALFTLAVSKRALGKPRQAREHLIAAIAAAETASANRTRARAWIAYAELVDDEGVRLEEARDALRLSAAILEQLGNPPELMLEREVAAGLVALTAGEHQSAVAAIQRSVDGAELPTSERTRRLQILARALIAAGQHEKAQRELERAEAQLVGELGSESPHLVPILVSMGEPLDYLGRQEEAIERMRRALAIFDASYGPNNPRRTTLLNNLAVIYANHGDLDRALAMHREVLALEIQASGDQAHATGIAHLNLAATMIEFRAFRESLEPLDRALKILTKTVGPDHPLLANVHALLFKAHGRLDHPAEALAQAQRALEIREAAEVGAGYLAHSRFEVAQALILAGRRADGVVMAKRALELPLATTGREGKLVQSLRELVEQHER